MITDRDRSARLKSDMFRARYHKVLRNLLISLGVLILLIAVIVYLLLVRTKPPYFATTTDGRIIPMIPISSQ